MKRYRLSNRKRTSQEAPISLTHPFETHMKKKIKNFYEEFDEKMNNIRKNLKRDDSCKDKEPYIFNFDEVPLWYNKKP